MENKSVPCFLCDGNGGWETNGTSEVCPVCRANDRELHARNLPLQLPQWDPFWEKMPAKHIGPLFNASSINPWLIIIHSAESGDNVAEYFSDSPDGRVVSTHLAWSRTHKKLVQCVPLNRVAWGAGGSVLDGNRHLNFCSIQIELPGPNAKDRDSAERGEIRGSILHLLHCIPSLSSITRHCDIDKRKRDPGKGFTWDWVDNLGLKIFTKGTWL